jgi:DNA-binding transcriptional ArsR family regulator
VLRALGTPRTTTGLAQALGLAPSTVSEHLAVLVSCRIANRRRRANRVFYGLSAQGVRLLRSFHDDEPP